LVRVATPSYPRTGSTRLDLVAIGASTGGPNALTEVLRRLPGSLPVPVIITQHMPPQFTKYLAERLDTVSELKVREATTGGRIEPGSVWVAPGDHHLVPDRREGKLVVELNQNPPENSCRPAVDPMFRAAAQVVRGRVLGVVQTGMGTDGAQGAGAIKEAGGQVIVQDQASSVVWGMPRAVVEAGHADLILPLADIADEILRRLAAGRAWSSPATAEGRG
jgi:two-component system chemotaxis response regulator CheB